MAHKYAIERAAFVTESLYRVYPKDEEVQRTNLHYARPADFFQLMTGGEWNVYSCNIWDHARTETESQIAKLNVFGAAANLQPGQRILDVGCGWGGPLVYLCKAFGVSGVGLTASHPQKIAGEERAAHYGVNVEIIESHWKDFQTAQKFDLIYSDEVLVHITDLLGLFRKLHSLLNPGGSMVHKELHLKGDADVRNITRGSSFINEIFGETGNYRTLADEVDLLKQAEFKPEGVSSIPNWHYRKTIDCWLVNMRVHRARLIDSAGSEFYFRMLKYLRIARLFVMSPAISVDFVHSKKRDYQ